MVFRFKVGLVEMGEMFRLERDLDGRRVWIGRVKEGGVMERKVRGGFWGFG